MIGKGLVEKNFSKYAKSYDDHSRVQRACGKALVGMVRNNGFKSVLDIGCGTGNYTKILRDKFPSAKIKAMDISKEMVKISKKKFADEKIEFFVADGERIDFKESFDLVSSNATFQWFSDLDKALNNYNKVLNSKGMILFSTFGPQTFFELRKSLDEFLGEVFSISASNFLESEKISHILKNTFKNAKVEELTFKETYGSLADLFKNIKYSGTRGASCVKRNFWTNRVVSEIEKVYIEKFKKIQATYQVFLFKAYK